MATNTTAPDAAPVRVPLLVPQLPTADKLRPYLERIDANHWYSNFGPLVTELEGRLATAFTGDGLRTVTVSNATAGIELALRALGLPAGALVLVPAFTFVATATAVLSAGLTPIACDVEERTWHLTASIASDAARRLDIRAVIPVCVFGAAHPEAEWTRFHEATGIPVIIDAAAAFGNQEGPGPTCAIFSMHATKPLSSGEGGFILTRSEEMERSVRQLSNFGINLTNPGVAPIGTSTVIGTNAKLSEFHAAVGLACLDAWEPKADLRRRNYRSYSALLAEASRDSIVWQAASLDTVRSVCAFLVESRNVRDRIEAQLARSGVATRRWYCPTVDQHRAFVDIDHLPTPMAHQIADRLVGVPFSEVFAAPVQRQVAEALHRAMKP